MELSKEEKISRLKELEEQELMLAQEATRLLLSDPTLWPHSFLPMVNKKEADPRDPVGFKTGIVFPRWPNTIVFINMMEMEEMGGQLPVKDRLRAVRFRDVDEMITYGWRVD